MRNRPLGTVYTAGALSGGTPLPSQGIEIDLGHQVEHIKMLGGEALEITNRETTGSAKFFLLAADEVTWRTDINSNTLSTMSFTHGTTAGNIVSVYMPSVQRINPQSEEMSGRVMMSVDLRMMPTATGNDELRIILK